MVNLATTSRQLKFSSGVVLVGLLGLIVGCGGSTGGGSTTGLTSSTGGGSGLYQIPVDRGNVSNGIITVLPSGQMVGDDGAGHGLYWSSPSANPQTMSGGIPLGLGLVGGQVKVVGHSTGSTITALLWSTPTGSPTLLATPVGDWSFAFDINSSGEIAGKIESSPSLNPVDNAVVWTSVSTSVNLPGTGGSSTFVGQAAAIFDDETIVGSDGTVWANKAATPTNNMPTSLSSAPMEFNKTAGGFGISYFYLPADIAHSRVTVAAKTGSTFSTGNLANPSGDIYAVIAGIAPNDWVLGSGQPGSGPNPNLATGFIWKTLAGAPVSADSLVPNLNGWHITSVDFGFSDGSLMVEGTKASVDSGNTHYLLLLPKP